jgi:uncharacterized membrane protein SpoIIM required for sporulation
MTAPSSRQTAVGPGPSLLEQRVEIETPEHVAFHYTIAGIGSRAAAALVDFFIVWGVVIGLWLLAIVLVALLGGKLLSGGGTEALTGSWVFAAMYLAYFALSWGYAVFFEAIADGQTPGKKRMGLRVVQDGGYSISFGASAVRNFVRVLDAQPGFLYAVGMVSSLFSKTGKRVGDHLAGTIVVHERVPDFAPAVSISAPLPNGSAPLISAQLTDDEFSLLQRFMARRQALDAPRRTELTAQLARRFADRLPEGNSDAARLVRLSQSEQEARASGVAARGVTGAAREQHALVARGAARWAAFTTLLERAKRGGLRAMPEADVAEFVASYRELTTDLARLRTATRGRESEALYYVSRLVAAGHNLLYRRREIALRQAWVFFSVTLPREVRRSWRPILAAALLLFGPAFITYFAVVRDPDLAYDLLPAGMIDRVENAAQNEERGGGYIKANELERPLVASTIMANNIQVTTMAFAAGATAGIGTVLVLVINGVSSGAAVGAYKVHHVAHLILGFVVAHGVLELTAICLGAGGGLLIGKAMLLPGALTRREAIVVHGRRAVRLATVATVLLVFAGTIEGLFSADPFWPLPYRVAMGAVTGLGMLIWFTRGWRGEADLPDEENAYAGLLTRD